MSHSSVRQAQRFRILSPCAFAQLRLKKRQSLQLLSVPADVLAGLLFWFQHPGIRDAFFHFSSRSQWMPRGHRSPGLSASSTRVSWWGRPATLCPTSPSCPSSCSLAPTPAQWRWRSSRPVPSSPPPWAHTLCLNDSPTPWYANSLVWFEYATRRFEKHVFCSLGEEAHQWLCHHTGHPHLLRSWHARGGGDSKTHCAN